MSVKDDYIDTQERPREIDDLSVHDESFIDLRGPARDAFGHPRRVVDFVKKYDWPSNIFQFGDLTFAGLKREIIQILVPIGRCEA